MLPAFPPTEPIGEELGSLLPAHFNDGYVAAAVFPIALEQARQAVPSPQLHPVEFLGAKGMAILCTFEYLDSTLGPYLEFAVGVVVRNGRNSGAFSTLDLFSASPDTGAWILAMPVTSERARRYGVQLFGYPKSLSPISVERSSRICTTTVHDGQVPILRAHLARHRGLKIPVPWLVTYTQRDGQLLRTRIKTRWWATLGSGGDSRVEIVKSEHPLAQKLLQLKLPKSPLIVLHGERFRAILPAGERI